MLTVNIEYALVGGGLQDLIVGQRVPLYVDVVVLEGWGL